MATLYRQYRPQKFADVQGQEHITQALTQAITRDRLAHAFLFCGPRGTGKTTTARILAKRVNCTKAKGAEPCGKCKVCVASQDQRNIDIVEIDAASNRGIDDIRSLRDSVSLAPSMGRFKVYIIDEVHMLTKEAFTALLKTLEEPSKSVLFILATTELHKVPATIMSRCQVYRFRRATGEEMRDRLTFILKKEKRSAEEEVINFIVSRSDGCYRDGESLLGQLMMFQEKKIKFESMAEFLGLPPSELIENFLLGLVKGESALAIEAVDKAFAQGSDPEQLLKESLYAARDAAINLAKKDDNLPSFARENGAAEKLPSVIRALIQAMQDIAYVPQPLIALHLAIISVCDKKGEVQVAPVTPKPVQEVSLENNHIEESKPKPEPVMRVDEAATKNDTVSIEQVKNVWPELIQQVKEQNPVASTFLRALHPEKIDGSLIEVQATYSLHRTFFDKAENKKLVEDILENLLGENVNIRCVLSEEKISDTQDLRDSQGKQGDKTFETVQEVFGAGN